MQAIRSVLILGFLVFFASIQSAKASNEIQNVLPSFTVDATEGEQASGFVVHFTNTSINVDETCGVPVSYAWTIDNGAMGVDWILVEGTSGTSTNLAIEFITQGCYNVQLVASDCNNIASSNPTEITVAGPPEIFVDDFTAFSTCSNGLAEALWQMASNNNNTINFNVFIDGAPLWSNTYQGLSFCTDPGTIFFADVVSAGFLQPGMHQLIFQAQGDLYTVPTVEIVDFEVFEAPTISATITASAFCSYEQATVQANIDFGLAPYVVDWSIDGLSQYTETVTGNSSSYIFDLNGISGSTNILVNLVDANGCSTSELIPIEVYEDVDFIVTTSATCEGTPAEFIAIGNASQYSWPSEIFSVNNPVITLDGTDTQSAVMGNGITVDVLGEIVYTGTLDGDLTCSSIETANAIVEVTPVLSISPAPGTTFCGNELAEIIVTGADTYVWSPSPASQNGGIATFPPNLASPLSGSATGTIDYADITCSSSILFNYEILDEPDVVLSVDSDVLCGPSDVSTVSTGNMDPATYSFQWWLNGFPIAGETGNEVTVTLNYPDDAGSNNIACQVTHNNGCVGGSVIQAEMLEGASISLDAPIICEADTFYIDVITNGNVSWSANGSTNISTGIYYYPVNNGDSYTGTATVTSPSVILGTDYNCSVDQTVVVETRALPDMDFVFSGTPCSGQSVQIDISGAQDYTWTSDPNETNSTSNSDVANPNLNTLSLGYTNSIPGDLEVNATGSITYPDANDIVCYTNESFTQNINSNTSFQLTGNTEICEEECIYLTIDWDDEPNGATFTYAWYLDGIFHSNGSTFTECPTYTSGTAEVLLVVEEGNECQSSQIIQVNTTQNPVVTATADVDEGCAPLIVNFTSTNQFASVTAWNFENGESDTGVEDTQMTFNCGDFENGDCIYPVSYTAISSFNPNCTASAFIPITVHPIPISEFNLDETVVCFDENNDAFIEVNNTSSELFGQTCADVNAPYNWTLFPEGSGDCTETIDEQPVLTATGSGTFTVGLDVTDAFGCSSASFQDFLIAEAPTPEIGFYSTSVCLPTQVEILNTTTGAATFELEVPGFVIPQNFNSPFYLDIEYPGVYEAEFTVTSIEGCSVSLELDNAFEAWNPPIAGFTTDPVQIDVLEPFANFVNQSIGGTEFIWSFGDGEGASEINPIHEYYTAGEYNVQLHVTNEYGCTDVATETINISNLLQIFVPNSFTPNNDGNNDAWIPVVSGTELIANYECWVYDRWGKLVFFSTTPGEPWIGDNTIDGSGTHYVSSTEAFSWRIEIKMIDGLGARTQTGHVYLVR